jgi:integrase
MGVKLRERKLKNGGISLLLAINHNSTTTYEFLFHINKEDDKNTRDEKMLLAKSMRAQRELETKSLGTDFTPNHIKNIEVLAYFKKFLNQYTKKDKRLIDGSIKKLESYFTNRDIHKGITFKQLTKLHITGFMDYLNHDANLNGETPHNYWKKFKLVLNQAYDENIINDNIFRNVRFKRKEEYSDKILKKNVLNDEEIQSLWNTPCNNEEIRKAFLFTCYTGLGLAEINQLRWEQIWDNKIDTKRAKTNNKIFNQLSPRILEEMATWERQNEFVFNLRNKSTNEFLSGNGINKSLKTWFKKAGINKHLTFYCGRHSFGTRLLMNGTNLKTVADAMAHSSTNVTQKYLNHTNSLKNDATSKLQ